MPALLEINNVVKNYDGKNAVLDGVSLELHKGEVIVLIGPSGCGKSTLLRCINGLEEIQGGSISLDGKVIDYKQNDLTKLRQKIGMVFQKPTLFPWLTVEDNVAFSLKMQGKLKEGMEDVQRLIKVIGLEKFKKDYPGQLSGGMAQRVALARAMISKPGILLMDEPLGALDAFTRMNMQNEILDMWQVNKQLVVMVTHDIDEAIHMSSRILVMEAHPGRIREEIKIDMDYPRNRSSSSFVEYRNHILDLLHFA